MDSLPNEIYYQILKYLDYQDLLSLSKTCSKLQETTGSFIFRLTFVNHRLKQNNIFYFPFQKLLEYKNRIINILKYIIQNDFVYEYIFFY